MIDPKEIRLNNFIKNKHGNFERVVEVTNIYIIASLIQNNPNFNIGHKYRLEQLYPIELTPEILEKCGFAIISNPNHTNSFLCYTPMMKLVLVPERKTITLRDYSGVQRSIQYLHELQNIHFALTSDELKYTP